MSDKFPLVAGNTPLSAFFILRSLPLDDRGTMMGILHISFQTLIAVQGVLIALTVQ